MRCVCDTCVDEPVWDETAVSCKFEVHLRVCRCNRCRR